MSVRDRFPRSFPTVTRLSTEASLAVGVFAAVVVFFVVATDPFRYPPLTNGDQVFFLRVGEAWVDHGVTPYVEAWDIKPPLIHEVSALAAAVTASTRQQYRLLVVITAVAAASVPAVTTALVYRETASRLASLTAAAVSLSLPTYWLFAAGSLRPKYGAAACGVAAIYALRRNWDGTAAAFGVLAAGWWQVAAIFPAIVLVRVVEHRREHLRRVLAVGLAVTAAVVAPIVLAGGLVPMLNQVVIAPFAVPESQSFMQDFSYAFRVLPYAAVLILFGLYAGPRALLADREWWPLVVPAVWFAAALLLFDLDGPPDTIPVFAVTGLAIGVYLGQCSVPRRAVVALAIAFVVIPVSAGLVVSEDPRESVTGMREWDVETAYSALGEQCHVRLSGLEEDWISRVGVPPDARVCSHQLRVP